MSDLFKITKLKINIVLSFLVLSFLFSALFSIFHRIIISNVRSDEELFFLIQHILPVPFFALTIFKFYLFACLAIYFINKAEKNKPNYQNAKN